MSRKWNLNGKITSKKTLSGKINDDIKREKIYLLDSITNHTNHQEIVEYSYAIYTYVCRKREKARASWAPAKHKRDRGVWSSGVYCIYTYTNCKIREINDTDKAAYVKKDRRIRRKIFFIWSFTRCVLYWYLNDFSIFFGMKICSLIN